MKRRGKFSLALVLILVLSISMSTAAFAAVRISKKSVTVAVNAPRWLHVDGTKKKVTWKSTNTKVVTVKQTGTSTGKKAGKATVVAKVAGKSYKCQVTVLSNKQIADRVAAKVRAKYSNARINDLERKGTYLDVYISRPMGEGAFMVVYRVNLKTGKAVFQNYSWNRELFPKAPRTMTVF